MEDQLRSIEINEDGMDSMDLNGEIVQESLITFDLHSTPCRSAAGALQQGVAPTAARSHREPQRCPKKHPDAAPPFTASCTRQFPPAWQRFLLAVTLNVVRNVWTKNHSTFSVRIGNFLSKKQIMPNSNGPNSIKQLCCSRLSTSRNFLPTLGAKVNCSLQQIALS